MKLSLFLLTTASICVGAWCQGNPTTAVEIVDEPHHTLVLQNQVVRVFRLSLRPNEVTLPHLHKGFYAFVSLRPVTISNEVRGRQPVLTELKAGELHTSKGGFAVAERNNSSDPAEVIVVEAMKPGDASGFRTPVGGFKMHDAGIIELFESSAVRGYEMAIAVGGRTEKHYEDYDRLLIALSESRLREEVDELPPSDLELKAGEIQPEFVS
jgi:hypothetical protein